MEVNTNVTYEAFFQTSNRFSQYSYYAAALYTQALLESGNFKQGIYLKTGNPFGMKKPRVRSTVNAGEYQSGFHADGSPRIFLVYSSLGQAVADRMMLDDYNKVQPPVDANDVLRYIDQVVSKGYAGDPDYKKKWIDLFKSYFTFGGYHYDGPGSEDSSNGGFLSNLGSVKIFGISFSLILLAVGAWWYFKKRKK